MGFFFDDLEAPRPAPTARSLFLAGWHAAEAMTFLDRVDRYETLRGARDPFSAAFRAYVVTAGAAPVDAAWIEYAETRQRGEGGAR